MHQGIGHVVMYPYISPRHLLLTFKTAINLPQIKKRFFIYLCTSASCLSIFHLSQIEAVRNYNILITKI